MKYLKRALILFSFFFLFIHSHAQDSTNYYFGTDHRHENFFNKRLNRNFHSYELGRMDKKRTIILRHNRNNWISSRGYQTNLDYYPIFKKGYGYFSFGYSNTKLFPRIRLNSEIYRTLPKGYEGSLGFRLIYSQDEKILPLYTGTIAKYIGNWWIRLRPSLLIIDKARISNITLRARRYLGGRYDFLGFSFIKGIDIEQPRNYLQSSTINVFMYRVVLKKSITEKIKGSIGVSHIYQYITNDYYHNIGIDFGIKRIF